MADNKNAPAADFAAIAGLHRIFGQVVNQIRKNEELKYYVVVIDKHAPPETLEFVNTDEVTTYIRDRLSVKQGEATDVNNVASDLYILVFQGRWWQLVTGPRRGLKCHEQFVPIKPVPIPESQIDPTGNIVAAFLPNETVVAEITETTPPPETEDNPNEVSSLSDADYEARRQHTDEEPEILDDG